MKLSHTGLVARACYEAWRSWHIMNIPRAEGEDLKSWDGENCLQVYSAIQIVTFMCCFRDAQAESIHEYWFKRFSDSQLTVDPITKDYLKPFGELTPGQKYKYHIFRSVVELLRG